ncbi:putative toxin-antitoxin system toxin component, PIN family [Candidatus Woesearchaeota archaeon]|nr:putative toxin-antitoxin system toxin component, PIN family [Candidatus Woesearchaeota archaeon]
MRIVLDTNVLVSGTYWSGSSFRILKMAMNEEFSLIISEKILDEYKKILYSDELMAKTDEIQKARLSSTEVLLVNSERVNPEYSFGIVTDDPDDDKFVYCAVEGKCDFLVSQDEHILKLKEYQRIRIVTPDEFLRIWTKEHRL